MSSLVEFYTFGPMEGAVVDAASSEAVGHPAEHAIAPLEPNMAWQSDEASAQHELELDLGHPRQVDALVWMHREVEVVPTTGVVTEIYWSHDAGGTWTLAGTDPVTPVTGELVKVVTLAPPVVARWWRVVFKGLVGPGYYAPENMRVSMCWLARRWLLDRSGGWPHEDSQEWPNIGHDMAFGQSWQAGRNRNPLTNMTRTWAVNDDEYDTLRGMLADANGGHSPIVLAEWGRGFQICWLDDDSMPEKSPWLGVTEVTLKFSTTPVVPRDGVA